MDQTDKKLLELLQQNGRLSLKQLGDCIGISSPAMKDSGVADTMLILPEFEFYLFAKSAGRLCPTV